MTALGVRVGDDDVGPGEARALVVPLPNRRGDAVAADAVPALVIAGHRPGPRVAILAGARGFEVGAARLVAGLEAWFPPREVTGTIVLVPVLRPGGRFAAGGRPVKAALVWRFPGDPAGSRAERDALAAFSALVRDSALVLTISEADPGRAATTAIKGDLDDPRARRLMRASGAIALIPAKRRRPDTVPDGAADAIHLEVSVSSPSALHAAGSATPGPLDDDAARGLPVEAGEIIRRLLHRCGVWAPVRAPAPPAGSSPVCRHITAILAPSGGFLEVLAAPGAIVAKGDPLARIAPPLARGALTLVAPHPGVILEAPDRAGTRRGAKLFVLGRLPRPSGDRPAEATLPRIAARPTGPARPQPAVAEPPVCIGWVERASLPDLGLELVAKIDTGARTSALHVTRMRVVTGIRGLGERPTRPVIEVTIPRGGKRPRADRVVRVRVREYVQIKDTSGRTERRPVIETTLRLGDLKRKIRVTLTDRGDMLYPMLIGRTALGAGVVVDPSRRRLLNPRKKPPR